MNSFTEATQIFHPIEEKPLSLLLSPSQNAAKTKPRKLTDFDENTNKKSSDNEDKCYNESTGKIDWKTVTDGCEQTIDHEKNTDAPGPIITLDDLKCPDSSTNSPKQLHLLASSNPSVRSPNLDILQTQPEQDILPDPIVYNLGKPDDRLDSLHRLSLSVSDSQTNRPNEGIKKLHSYSGPCTASSTPVIANNPGNNPNFLGLVNPALSGASSRKSSEVVKERVAKLGYIPERPGVLGHSLGNKRNSQGILSEAEIFRYLDPLKRSHSQAEMSEKKTITPKFSTRSTLDYATSGEIAPTSISISESIEKDENSVSSPSYMRQKDNLTRPKVGGVSWKRKRDYPKRRNPFVGVIGRSASVRQDVNSKSTYNFTSIVSQDLEELNQKFDSTPSLTNIKHHSFTAAGPKISAGSVRTSSFSHSVPNRNCSISGKQRSFLLDEAPANAPSPGEMKRQMTAASLTAETAELLGTPTPADFEAPAERCASRVSGGLDNNNTLGLVYYVVLNAIRDSIQPNNSKMALKLFGSKKCVLKEKKRCEEEAPWIIHPFSTFRYHL